MFNHVYPSENLGTVPFHLIVYQSFTVHARNFFICETAIKKNMIIILFALGVILIIIGLQFYFSCQIHVIWENRSRRKTGQTNQQSYQHGRRDRAIGLFFMIIGVILILLSFAGSVM